MPDLTAALALILAISLAGERIVAIVKNLVPGWFAEPATGASVDPRRDRWRRLRVQGVAFAACWAAAAFLADPVPNHLFGMVAIGDALELPAYVVGLLTMGGSAFWAQIIGIGSALKDLKQAQVGREARTPAAPAPARPDAIQVHAIAPAPSA